MNKKGYDNRAVIESIKQFLGLIPRQHTWVWCPYCRNELTRVGAVIRDGFPVIYDCPGCGALTCWDFDAPAPLYMPGMTKLANGPLRPRFTPWAREYYGDA